MMDTSAPTTPGRAPAAAIAALRERGSGGTGPAGAGGDPLVRGRAERFLLAEARLLDARRFEEWLDLWHAQGLLWVPIERGHPADPVEHQSLVLDDRVRLGERVERLRSRAGWSQIPVTRTIRHLGNIEAWADGESVEVRSVVTLHAHRDGVSTLVAARQEHRLVPDGDHLLIELKVLDLIDADGPHPNLSYLF